MLVAAAGLWMAGHSISSSQHALRAHPDRADFGIAGSGYGSLLARLMRNSLHSYWHVGEGVNMIAPLVNKPPSSILNRFSRRIKVTAIQKEDFSRLKSYVRIIYALEVKRTKRNSPFQLSTAHQRYLNAAADWRLRLAYKIDPGDVMLYEILHYELASRSQHPEAARELTNALAQEAIVFSTREQSSLSSLLTGASAVINIINNLLDSESSRLAPEVVRQHWNVLDRYLMRYRNLKSAAQAEGWWDGIPTIRQQELEEHYLLLERISSMIRSEIPAKLRDEHVQRP